LPFCACALFAADKKPNFIIILADDQGYADLGVFGAKDIETPCIDALAKDSVIARSFYTSTVCTPARAALQTGKYHAYVKQVGLKSSVYFPSDEGGMSPEEITIAETLKPQGYKTALIGKWHLGCTKEYLPVNQGYDYFYGLPYSNDMWLFKNPKYAKDLKITNGMSFEQIRALEGNKDRGKAEHIVPLMRGDEVIEVPAVQATLTERYFDEAIKFITQAENDKAAFYVCITPNMPHVPLYASEKFAGKSKRGAYGDVIQELDYNVGRLISALKEKGLYENTVIIYTSDNGPWLFKKQDGGSATPLRNGKGSLFEGGVRVPCIIHLPSALGGKPFDTSEIIATIDILPTFARLAGAQVPQASNGLDLTDFLKGKVAQSPRKEFLYFSAGNKISGMRLQNFKVLFEKPDYGYAQEQSTPAQKGQTPPFLFDLKRDIGENDNLAKADPAKKTELEAAAKTAAKEHE